MKTLRQSIYDKDQIFLRDWLIAQRNKAGLTQRELAEKLNIVHSFIGKVEIGERRLDVLEFIKYCQALDADPCLFLKSMSNQ